MGTRPVVLIVGLILLVSSVSAVRTVEDLWNQGDAVSRNVQDMAKSFDSFTSKIEDQIRLIGIQSVLAFILAYVFLECARYLFIAWWGWKNRRRYEKERDRFVENLRASNVQLIERQRLLGEENNLLRANSEALHRILEARVKQPSYPFRTILYSACGFFVSALILVYFDHRDGVLLLAGAAFSCAIIGFYLYRLSRVGGSGGQGIEYSVDQPSDPLVVSVSKVEGDDINEAVKASKGVDAPVSLESAALKGGLTEVSQELTDFYGVDSKKELDKAGKKAKTRGF